ncbi:uncharacterized protein PAC_11719 [Phialocephala subalpina]|uniref:Uncharacterized protein n=1 Tax=Phialocephala subalpina TaxID=576137 RepID=A0A1L7X9Y8_9HELO|nr:uncharacterized protein PAC_11719 [Phialocephala subalpina]
MVFSIDDQQTWRVTEEHPVREMDSMDWERCAALHNLIIHLGWTGSGKDASEMPRQTWWQAKITSDYLEEEWSRRLSPSLSMFLRAAFDQPQDQNFFYYAACLNSPQQLVNPLFEEDHLLCLYQMTNLSFSGHKDGVNFDQETFTAIFHRDIGDSRVTLNGRIEWDPLEVVLSAWLGMFDTGKIIVRSKDTTAKGPWECSPWEILPYSQHDLQTAVNGFDNLILRVECLLEDPTLQTRDNPDDQAKLIELTSAKFDINRCPEEFGLIPTEVLDHARVPEGFIRDFLTQVRRPKKGIRYIAPGLRLPVPSDFSPHPFQNFQLPESVEDDSRHLPIPLFISDLKSSAPLLELYPFNETPNLNYGLWMKSCNKTQDVEDACRLWLPFEIGANGFARLTDDSLVGEDQESSGLVNPRGRNNELYQPGYCHFVPFHGPQLGIVLELWSNLVGLGEWEVGQEGVEGGIEKFKEADTDEHFHKYQVCAKW